MADSIERRKDKRFYMPAAALSYRRLGITTDVLKGSLVNNISTSGAKITVNDFLPVNLKLAIELFLPAGCKYISGGSHVAWVNKKPFNEQYEIGMKFDDFTQADYELLAAFIPLERTWPERLVVSGVLSLSKDVVEPSRRSAR